MNYFEGEVCVPCATFYLFIKAYHSPIVAAVRLSQYLENIRLRRAAARPRTIFVRLSQDRFTTVVRRTILHIATDFMTCQSSVDSVLRQLNGLQI